MNNSTNNSVRLTGNLAAAPEVRIFDAGKKLARLRMATSDSYTNAKGEQVTDTQWHNVIAWGKLAEQAADKLSKGSLLCLEGKLVNKSYTDKDGVKKYVTEVVANSFELLQKATA
ncbi:MAG: single-stranded DNA-binding protein [Bacteroidetes bacterium]|nr:MAG: single-stranded DNA-binding protein [Bacteroidota bacterium]